MKNICNTCLSLGILGVIACPFVAYGLSFSALVKNMQQTIFTPVVAIIIGLAVLVLAWGIGIYLTSENPAKRKQGIEIMIAGIFGLVVMVSVWGLVNLTMKTINKALPGVDYTSLPTPSK